MSHRTPTGGGPPRDGMHKTCIIFLRKRSPARYTATIMLTSVDELPDTLREHVPNLYACVNGALADFVAAHNDRRVDYTSRTEASIIHDYMVKHAKVRFPCSWTLKQNLFLIRVGQDYLVKLKRLDHHFHASRIPTISRCNSRTSNSYLSLTTSPGLIFIWDIKSSTPSHSRSLPYGLSGQTGPWSDSRPN